MLSAFHRRKRRNPCPGTVISILPDDTLNLIAQRFGLSPARILQANPQIRNPNRLRAGEQLCIPVEGGAGRPPEILSVGLLGPDGRPLPVSGGFVLLAPVTTVRAAFSRDTTHVFFFLTPTGTGGFASTRLIGAVPDGRVVDFEWQVPPAALGRIFVIGCDGAVCRQSAEIAVVREEDS